MKSNAIARIIIYSVLVLVLVGILFAVLGGKNFFTVNFGGNNGTPVIGSLTLPSSDVRNLEINWASGSISITRGDVDEILVEEIANGEIKTPMTYNLSGNTLQLNYAEGNIRIGFGIGSVQKKDLHITVPMDWDCGNLTINSASTDVQIKDLAMDLLELDTASSDCKVTNCNTDKLELNGASCDLTFNGALNTLNCDGASTEITAVFTNVPDSINMDGASADLDITLPADCGFRVEMDGVSNRFSSDFATRNSDGSYSYGNGECEIEVDGVSASVNIRKGN